MRTLVLLIIYVIAAPAQAVSYYNQPEFAHQASENEHIFFYSHEWDKYHSRFYKYDFGFFTDNAGNIQDNEIYQTLGWEYGMTENTSFGVHFNYQDVRKDVHVQPIFPVVQENWLNRDRIGFSTVDLVYKVRKTWTDSQLFTKTTFSIPFERHQSFQDDSSGGNSQTANGSPGKTQLNFLLGYHTDVFYEHYMGLALEATVFQEDAETRFYDYAGNTINRQKESGGELFEVNLFYEIPDPDYLVGASLQYREIRRIRERQVIFPNSDKTYGTHSYELELYFRTAFFNMFEVVTLASVGSRLSSGNSRTEELYIRRGTQYGSQIVLRQFF